MNAVNIDTSLLEEIQSHAIRFVQEAGRICLDNFSRPVEVKFKGQKDRDPVTTADHHSDAYLKQAIKEKFPQHVILSEEGDLPVDSNSPFVWVIDPLDGTINFMNGLPLFAVSVGVLWRRQPVVGSIYVPVSHYGTAGVYHACLGKGAFFNGISIEVRKEASALPLCGVPSQFGGRFRLAGPGKKEPCETRNLGVIALELALIACGVLQYAVFTRPKIWDIAAGILLVKEAGGLTFARQTKSRDWLALERFQMEQPLAELRDWSSSIVVGAPDITGRVVKNIRNPRALLSWLSALHRH